MEKLRADESITEEPATAKTRPSDQGAPSHPEFYKIFNGEIEPGKPVTTKDIIEAWEQFDKASFREWEKFARNSGEIDTTIVPPDGSGKLAAQPRIRA